MTAPTMQLNHTKRAQQGCPFTAAMHAAQSFAEVLGEDAAVGLWGAGEQKHRLQSVSRSAFADSMKVGLQKIDYPFVQCPQLKIKL